MNDFMIPFIDKDLAKSGTYHSNISYLQENEYN